MQVKPDFFLVLLTTFVIFFSNTEPIPKYCNMLCTVNFDEQKY